MGELVYIYWHGSVRNPWDKAFDIFKSLLFSSYLLFPAKQINLICYHEFELVSCVCLMFHCYACDPNHLTTNYTVFGLQVLPTTFKVKKKNIHVCWNPQHSLEVLFCHVEKITNLRRVWKSWKTFQKATESIVPLRWYDNGLYRSCLASARDCFQGHECSCWTDKIYHAHTKKKTCCRWKGEGTSY